MKQHNNPLIKRIFRYFAGKEIWNAKMSENLKIQIIEQRKESNDRDNKEDEMGGHVLWLDSDVIRVLEAVFKMSGRNATYLEYVEALQPLLEQAAYKEQIHIVHKLVESGMSEEECAFRLGCTKERIMKILDYYNEKIEYDYSYMNLKGLFSKGE